GGMISLAPALIALRGGELAAYHGAEHISIGTYEHGHAEKEHERCGSHLVGPLILASAAGAGLAARVPGRLRKPASLAASLGAFAASTEVFGWMTRNPEHPVARLLTWPGTELQSRVATARATRRLPPEIFDLPVDKMRAGWYTDAYFNHARDTLLADGRRPRVVMQVFQKNHAYLGGMDEAIAVLKLCSHDWEALTVHALYDGDPIEPWETVMTVEGDFTLFAHLETVYLGVLARRTLVTTNVVAVLEAANGKPVIFMPARHDHHRIQTGDGYAAHVAGRIVGTEIGVTTDEQASWWGGKGVGTVPHALIGAYGGNTVLAATKFAEWAPEDLNVTVLVDFENNSVETALEVARALGPRLWGVRLDTSE